MNPTVGSIRPTVAKHTITMHVGVWVFWVTTALSAGASGSFAAARGSHSHSDAEVPATIQFASVFESSSGVNPVLQQEQWVAVWGNSSSIGEKSDSHCNRWGRPVFVRIFLCLAVLLPLGFGRLCHCPSAGAPVSMVSTLICTGLIWALGMGVMQSTLR